MLRNKLKAAMSGSRVPSDEAFNRMSRSEQMEVIFALDKDTQTVEDYMEDELHFNYFKMCRICESKKITRQKSFRNYFANYCANCYPNETKEVRKPKTLEDVLSGNSTKHMGEQW